MNLAPRHLSVVLLSLACASTPASDESPSSLDDELETGAKLLASPDPSSQSEGTERLKRLLRDHPTFPRNDEVLLLLGTSTELPTKERVKLLWTLIKQFPKSKHAGGAYFALAQHFEAESKLHKASKARQRACAHGVKEACDERPPQ